MMKKILILLLLSFLGLTKLFASDDNLVVIFPVTMVSPELADNLIKMFEEEHKISTRMIALCTGDAIKFVKETEERVDAMLGHDLNAEKLFVEEGYAVNLRAVCYSQYVLVGPPDDPAKVKGSKNISAALRRIKKKKSKFFSRGDKSGTHCLEMEMWEKTKIKPKGDWYVITNTGTDATLDFASRRKGYFISHKGSYLDMKETLDLEVMLEDEDLVTPYHAMVLNPEKYKTANYVDAMTFIGFLTSPKIQKYISEYAIEKYGGQTWFPLAVKN